MRNTLIGAKRVAMALALAAFCGTGCTSISLESNKNAAAIHKVDRLFILINQGEVKDQPLSKMLATAFQNCFTNAAPKVDIAITSPLDLDENAYKASITNFHADAVFVVSVNTFIIDEFGGYPTIMYDASLFDPSMKQRVWRAAINNSGGTALMERRMWEMAEKIVQQLHQDGFF